MSSVCDVPNALKNSWLCDYLHRRLRSNIGEVGAIQASPFTVLSFSFFSFGFSRQGFSVASVPVLELALVDQAGLELPEIHLPLPPEC